MFTSRRLLAVQARYCFDNNTNVIKLNDLFITQENCLKIIFEIRITVENMTYQK